MPQKAIALDLAKKYGATVEKSDDGNAINYYFDTPLDFIWVATGDHTILAWAYRGDKSWIEAELTDAIERMEMGIRACDIENCDRCSELREETGDYESESNPGDLLDSDYEMAFNPGDPLDAQTPFLLQKLSSVSAEPENLLYSISEFDPTETKKITHKLVDWYADNTLKLPEDGEKLKQAISEFTHIKKLYPEFPNFTKFGSLQDLVLAIDKKLRPRELRVQARQKRITSVHGSKKIYEDAKYTILEVTETEAACDLASGTKWCTSSEKTSEYYLEQGPLYIIHKDGRKYAQLHVKSGQIMDIHDRPLWSEEWSEELGGAEPEPDADEEELKDILVRALPASVDLAFLLKKRIPRVEEYILSKTYATLPWKQRRLAYDYATKVIQGRWPEAEPLILEYAVSDDVIGLLPQYAENYVHGRWPEAEQYIMRDPKFACEYAMRVIKGRWPEAEPYIMKELYYAMIYARTVIKGRWPEAEAYIMQDPESAYRYAKYILQGRWPEAEPYIMQDPQWAYSYEHQIIKGR